LTEFNPITEVRLPPFHLNGVELGLLAGRNGLGENLAFDKRFHGPQLDRYFPLEIEGDRQCGNDQN
jgi:hypothetical protein